MSCNSTCCFLDSPASRTDCNKLKNISGNQLIYYRNIALYAKFISNFENVCTNSCNTYNCKSNPKQLPYCASFEDVLKMKKAQDMYSSPNYKNGII